MNEIPPARQLDCVGFDDRLFHFQADELAPDERRAMQGHLDACPACAWRNEIEQSLLGEVKRRLARAPAPAGLEGKLRAALGREAGGQPARTSWRAAWTAAIAASVLLGVILLPGLGALTRMAVARPLFVTVAGEVVVVDLDCDRAGVSVAQQRGCDHPQHVNALRNDAGGYWHLGVDDPAVRALVLDPKMRGHRLEVLGDLDSRTGALRLARFIDLGLSV